MNLSIELSESEWSSLRERAAQLGVVPEQLVRAAVAGLVTRPDDDFERAAGYVLKKNRELYERLS